MVLRFVELLGLIRLEFILGAEQMASDSRKLEMGRSGRGSSWSHEGLQYVARVKDASADTFVYISSSQVDPRSAASNVALCQSVTSPSIFFEKRKDGTNII